MEMTLEKRLLISEALQLMIECKEDEIEEIKEKTVDDYRREIRRAEKPNAIPFSLPHHKEKEIEKIRLAIMEIRKLDETIIGGTHHILAVPKSIRLSLTTE